VKYFIFSAIESSSSSIVNGVKQLDGMNDNNILYKKFKINDNRTGHTSNTAGKRLSLINKIRIHHLISSLNKKAGEIYYIVKSFFDVFAAISFSVKTYNYLMSQEGKMEGLSLEAQSALKKQLSKVAFIVNESDFAAVSQALTEK
jgi:hypothetical protein